MRIISMPPPAALTELPDLAVQQRELSASTEAAINVLNSDAARSAVIRSGSAPAAPLPAPVVAEVPAFAAHEPSESTKSVAKLRARMWAMIAGGAAATAGVVALVATAF